MLDAHFANIVEVADAVAAGEFPTGLALLGGFDVLVGDISCKDRLDKGQKWYGPNRSRRY